MGLEEGLEESLAQARAILELLGLMRDPPYATTLAELEIECKGREVCVLDDPRLSDRLDALHKQRIGLRLEALVRDALGYYSLPALDLGQNEPPPGDQELNRLCSSLLEQCRNQQTDLYNIYEELNKALHHD